MKTKKKVILSVICWMLLFLAVLFPTRYLNSIFGYLAFLFLLVLCGLSWLICLILKKNIMVKCEQNHAGMRQCVRGGTIKISLQVKNRSFLTSPLAKAEFYISDLYGQTDASLEANMILPARSECVFSPDLDMKHVGVYEAGIRKIRIYGLFGSMAADILTDGVEKICVRPQIRRMEELELEENRLSEATRDTRNTMPDGTDYTGVREYRPGDPMKQIHWKLSAHSRDYMTKLSESSRESEFAVFLDFSADPAESEQLMGLYDTLIETAYALLNELICTQTEYTLVYGDRMQEIQCYRPASTDRDIEGAMACLEQFDILRPNPQAGYPDAEHMLVCESGFAGRSTNPWICTTRVTAALIRRLIWEKQQGRQPELFWIIPETWSQKEREVACRPLRELEEVQVGWHLISAVI